MKGRKVITSTVCSRCRRDLSNGDSMSRGYGPVCWRKITRQGENGKDLMDSFPRTIQDGAKAQASFARITQRILKAVEGQACSCKTPLSEGEIWSYDHEGGVDLEGFGVKQWVYVKCKCGHLLAFHHIRGLDQSGPSSEVEVNNINEMIKEAGNKGDLLGGRANE